MDSGGDSSLHSKTLLTIPAELRVMILKLLFKSTAVHHSTARSASSDAEENKSKEEDQQLNQTSSQKKLELIAMRIRNPRSSGTSPLRNSGLATLAPGRMVLCASGRSTASISPRTHKVDFSEASSLVYIITHLLACIRRSIQRLSGLRFCAS